MLQVEKLRFRVKVTHPRSCHQSGLMVQGFLQHPASWSSAPWVLLESTGLVAWGACSIPSSSHFLSSVYRGMILLQVTVFRKQYWEWYVTLEFWGFV